jgi:signal transduction histidine kinase
VCYHDGDVEIEVDDEGVTGPQPLRSTGSGSGIAGMTDRAQAVGGWLTAGPLPGGGFRVTALLPTGGSEA